MEPIYNKLELIEKAEQGTIAFVETDKHLSDLNLKLNKWSTSSYPNALSSTFATFHESLSDSCLLFIHDTLFIQASEMIFESASGVVKSNARLAWRNKNLIAAERVKRQVQTKNISIYSTESRCAGIDEDNQPICRVAYFQIDFDCLKTYGDKKQAPYSLFYPLGCIVDIQITRQVGKLKKEFSQLESLGLKPEKEDRLKLTVYMAKPAYLQFPGRFQIAPQVNNNLRYFKAEFIKDTLPDSFNHSIHYLDNDYLQFPRKRAKIDATVNKSNEVWTSYANTELIFHIFISLGQDKAMISFQAGSITKLIDILEFTSQRLSTPHNNFFLLHSHTTVTDNTLATFLASGEDYVNFTIGYRLRGGTADIPTLADSETDSDSSGTYVSDSSEHASPGRSFIPVQGDMHEHLNPDSSTNHERMAQINDTLSEEWLTDVSMSEVSFSEYEHETLKTMEIPETLLDITLRMERASWSIDSRC